MNNNAHLFICSINFLKLDEIADCIISEVAIKQTKKTIDLIQSKLGFPVDQISIITKCNGVSIVITYYGEYENSFIKGRLLSVWDECAEFGLINAYKYIKTYEDVEAIRYLSECALGINSVSIGDSQVLSQVCDALQNAITYGDNINFLSHIILLIKKLSKEVKLKTSLYKGNTSLERIACELLTNQENYSTEKIISVIGAGKTGELVVKILSSEAKANLFLTNRTSSKVHDIAKKYPSVKQLDFNDITKISESTFIIFCTY